MRTSVKNDTGTSLLGGRSIGPNFSTTVSTSASGPGTYLVCMWIQQSSNDNIAAFASSQVVTVRQPNLALALIPPASPRAGRQLVLTARVQTEVERELYVTIKPAGSSPCGSAVKTDTGTSVIGGRDVEGGPKDSTQAFSSDTPGTYLLCGYIQESSNDDTAELASQATMTIPLRSTKLRLRGHRVRGGAVRSGSVTGPSEGKVVIERKAGGRWVRLKSAAFYYGAFTTKTRVKKGTFRARFNATADYAATTSSEVKLW